MDLRAQSMGRTTNWLFGPSSTKITTKVHGNATSRWRRHSCDCTCLVYLWLMAWVLLLVTQSPSGRCVNTSSSKEFRKQNLYNCRNYRDGRDTVTEMRN